MAAESKTLIIKLKKPTKADVIQSKHGVGGKHCIPMRYLTQDMTLEYMSKSE